MPSPPRFSQPYTPEYNGAIEAGSGARLMVIEYGEGRDLQIVVKQDDTKSRELWHG